jgi:ferredoxin
MLHSDTGSRTVDLLTELGLESHILYDITDFNDFSMFKIDDPAGLRKRIDTLKKSSTAFLLKNLGLTDQYNKVKCPTHITKADCYGCQACKDICKAGAIRMKANKDGFLYPVVDKAKCTKCGQCKKVCIRRHPQTISYDKEYPKAYTAYHMNLDIRKTNQSQEKNPYAPVRTRPRPNA